MIKAFKAFVVVAFSAWLAWAAWGPYLAWSAANDLALPLDEIRKEWRPGDLVMLQPRRLVLDAAGVKDLPIVAAPVDRYVDLSGWRRVWIVHPKGRLATPTFRNDLTRISGRPAGDLAVALYEVRHRGDRDAVAAMRVELVPPEGPPKACEKRGDGTFYCGPNGWNFVGLHPVQRDNLEEPCIWAHPQQAAITRITLPDGPRSGEVRIHAQLADSAVADAKLPPVKVTVRSGGHERVIERLAGKGLLSQAVRVEPGVPFTIEVSTAQESRQHFCFHVEW